MVNGKTGGAITGTMLLFDAIVGVALAVLVNPVVGALAFVVSATISILTSRKIRIGSVGATSPAPAPPAPSEPAEAPDPSYNPYARED